MTTSRGDLRFKRSQVKNVGDHHGLQHIIREQLGPQGLCHQKEWPLWAALT